MNKELLPRSDTLKLYMLWGTPLFTSGGIPDGIMGVP